MIILKQLSILPAVQQRLDYTHDRRVREVAEDARRNKYVGQQKVQSCGRAFKPG